MNNMTQRKWKLEAFKEWFVQNGTRLCKMNLEDVALSGWLEGRESMKKEKSLIVLVHYRTTNSFGFTFNNNLSSKIVTINDYEELNDMFDFIEQISLLEGNIDFSSNTNPDTPHPNNDPNYPDKFTTHV